MHNGADHSKISLRPKAAISAREKVPDMHRPIILALDGSAYGLKAPSQPSGRSTSEGDFAFRAEALRPDCFAIVVARAALSTAKRIFPALSRMITSDLSDNSTEIEGPASFGASKKA
jgi:hypothetical protein